MYDFYALISTQNRLNFKDLRDECQAENWAPVVILRYKDRVVVPLFTSAKIATDFLRRNLPRKEICGVLAMINEDQKIFTDRGWEIDWHSHPKKYKDRTDVELDVDGIDIATGFNLSATSGRPRV